MRSLTQIQIDMLKDMTDEQRKEAYDYLVALIELEYENLSSDYKIDYCPRCGSISFIRDGKPNGKQRYLCKECNRHFSAATYSILAFSKLECEVWVKYVECMFNFYSLRKCAYICDVGLKTSFFMRHRICEMMNTNLEHFRVNSNCSAQIDEYHLHCSYKGNQKLGCFKIPRDIHKRGNDVHTRGISSEQISVLSGINEHGDCFLQLACRGRISEAEAYDILSDKVCEGAIISTDKHRSYKDVMKKLNVAIHNAFDSKDYSQGNINLINSLHSRLSRFLNHFIGVSTRRLSNYLSWFCWIESFKKIDVDNLLEQVGIKQVFLGRYKTVWRKYKMTPYPFEPDYDLCS